VLIYNIVTIMYNLAHVIIYIFKIGTFQFGLWLVVASYRRRYHGDASWASL